jgi:hypothetical protein
MKVNGMMTFPYMMENTNSCLQPPTSIYTSQAVKIDGEIIWDHLPLMNTGFLL